MKTISILNLKGGVAKTFTAENMAYEIYRRGYRVLLIDNDKQGNLSKAYSRYDAESVAPVTRLLAGDWQGATELIQNTNYVGQQCCIDIVTLQHKPNYFMDTTKFIKRLATYVAVEHTAFIIPIEDECRSMTGWYSTP